MLLALDSATRQAGLALYDGESVRAEALWSSSLHHTEWLTPAVAQALQRTNASAADLSVVAVTRGPGSFTGLRVAMSLAKGIAAAQGLPILGVPSLDVTAYPHLGEQPVLATLPAGRGRHAYTIYAPQPPSSSPAVTTEASITNVRGLAEVVRAWHQAARERLEAEEDADPSLALPLRVVGEWTPAERDFLLELGAQAEVVQPALAVRRPAVLAALAWQRWQAGESDDLHALEPDYLHLPRSGK